MTELALCKKQKTFIKNMKKEWFSTLALMLVLTGTGMVSGCSNQETPAWPEVIRDIRNRYPEVRQLRTDELYSWLKGPERKRIILIDAREKEEFQVSHISGAMNIPCNKDPLIHLKDINPDRPVVVYCSVGYRSSILAGRLKDLGFNEVYNLEGSIFKWANEERPLVQGQKEVHTVHPYNARWGSLLEEKYHAKDSNAE